MPSVVADTTETKPRPKRRWFQFSLRTLLIGVTICGIGFGWFAMKLHEARRQFRAVQSIEDAGGHVFYDYQIDGVQRPSTPDWLIDIFGKDCFCNVVQVTTEIAAPLEYVAELPRLRCVNFGFLDISWPIGMSWPEVPRHTPPNQIPEKQAPRRIAVPWKIPDRGLQFVSQATQLEELCLFGSVSVSDDGLAHLAALSNLKKLEIPSPYYSPHGCTDAGIERLRKALPNCEITLSH